MKYIENFLNNTTLSAGQTILITLISITLVEIYKKSYNTLVKKVSKLLKPIREKSNRIKRLKRNKTMARDHRDLLLKSESGKQLSKDETELLNRLNKQWQESVKEISHTRVPKLPT